MTNYVMIEVDKIEVEKIVNSIYVRFKKDRNNASICLSFEQLKTLIDYAQATLQDSELVEEGVGK